MRGTRTADAQSTSTRGGTANDTEYPTALGHCGGGCQRTHSRVRRGHAHGSATVRAGARRSAYGHQRAGARTHARRAHRKLSCLSSDSAAGIVPSSELEPKSLRHAWFVPLCSEMLMHRSVPRTHTDTARVGRIGSSSESVLHTGTRGVCCTRALFVPGRRRVLQPCRSAHTPSIVLVQMLERSQRLPRTERCCEGTRTVAEGALARCSHTRPHGAR